MSDKIAIRLCVDTGFSHDSIAVLWYRHLGAWAAYHAEMWANECASPDVNDAAMEWLRRALDSDFRPDELADPNPKVRHGGDWPTVRIAFVPGGYHIYVEFFEDGEPLLRQLHRSGALRSSGPEWEELFNLLERQRGWQR